MYASWLSVSVSERGERMKLVIDIDKEDFTLIRSVNSPNVLLLTESRAMLAVKNGKPLDAVLDKIRAEIENIEYLSCPQPHVVLNDVLQIIDKYKAEGSDTCG